MFVHLLPTSLREVGFFIKFIQLKGVADLKRKRIETKKKQKQEKGSKRTTTKEEEVVIHKTVKGNASKKEEQSIEREKLIPKKERKITRNKKMVWLKRLILFNVVLLFVVLASYYLWNKNKIFETSPSQDLVTAEEVDTNEEVDGKRIAVNQMNQDVMIDDTFSYNVSSVIRTKQIGDPTFLGAKALENQEYLIVEYLITNNSHRTVEPLDLPMIQLFNIDGTQIPRNKDGFISYVTEVKEESFGIEPLPSKEKVTQYEVFLIDSQKLDTEEWLIMSGDTLVEIDLEKVKEMEKI